MTDTRRRWFLREDDPNFPNHIMIDDAHLNQKGVAMIGKENGLMWALMLNNAYNQRSVEEANEFGSGFIYGMTYAIMFPDELPKTTITKDGVTTHLKITMPGKEN